VYSTKTFKKVMMSSGMFQWLQSSSVRDPNVDGRHFVGQSFSSDIYVIAAFFDPRFKLQWIDNDRCLAADEKEILRTNVKGSTVCLNINSNKVICCSSIVL
jgi:hypothetical protein